MAIDWPYKSLREISATNARSFAMGPFGSNIRKENYRSVGVPVIRGLNLNAERFYDAGFVFLTEEKADELRNSSAFPQDIVFVAQGTIGQVGIIPKHSRYPRYVLSQNLMKVTCDTDKVDPLYVFYYFRSHYGQHEIFAYANPTGVPCISQPLTSLKSFRVPVVPLPKQCAIATVLSSLDDKIELNRRMNETLEAMVRALFKSWFVDFEPFRDKGMEESLLGEIPMGWSVITIGDIGDVVCGKTPPTRDADNYGGHIPFIKIPDMHGKVFVTQTGGYLTEKGAKTQPKKLLPRHAVCVSCIATLGLVALTSQPSHTNQQINSIICNDSISPFWCYLAMINLRHEIITGGAGGSATLNLNKNEFSKLQAIKPSQVVMWKFHQIVEPLFSRILSNELENIKLADIRDSLLPKLLSGEIRVKDAEKFMEEAI